MYIYLQKSLIQKYRWIARSPNGHKIPLQTLNHRRFILRTDLRLYLIDDRFDGIAAGIAGSRWACDDPGAPIRVLDRRRLILRIQCQTYGRFGGASRSTVLESTEVKDGGYWRSVGSTSGPKGRTEAPVLNTRIDRERPT